jgi:hypothetical protein
VVPGAGAAAAVQLSPESLHPARKFLDALQERNVLDRSAKTRNRRQEGGFDYVCTADRGI